MKNILFALLLCGFSASSLFAAQDLTTFEKLSNLCRPDLKIVVTPKKVWFVHDAETPMKYLTVQVQDVMGKVLIEKGFDQKDCMTGR